MPPRLQIQNGLLVYLCYEKYVQTLKFSHWHLIGKCIKFSLEVRTRLFFLYDHSEVSSKISLGWSAKNLEILKPKNIAFRSQHTKFSILGLIPRLWCSYCVEF